MPRFAAVLARMVQAGMEAVEDAARTQFHQYLRLFRSTTDGQARAPRDRMLDINGSTVPVPEAVLTPLNAATVKRIRMEWEQIVAFDDHGEGSLSSHGSMVQVTLTMDVQDPPEGISLVRDRLNQDLATRLNLAQDPTPVDPEGSD